MKIPLLSQRRISVNNTYTPEPVDERRAAEGTKTPETRPGEAMPHRAKDWIIWIVALAFACFHLYTATMTGSLLAPYQRSNSLCFCGYPGFLDLPITVEASEAARCGSGMGYPPSDLCRCTGALYAAQSGRDR